MDVAISVIPTDETQETWPQHRAVDPAYTVHVGNWKLAGRPGSLIGTFDASIPSFALSLHCALRRDHRGNPYIDMPRVRVETPNGQTHLKRLARWNTREAEKRFQDAALAALRLLLSREGCQ